MNIYNKLAVLARKAKGKANTDHNAVICADGGVICAKCLLENYRLILVNTREYNYGEGNTAQDCKQWAAIGTQTENGTPCDNCYKQIVPEN